MYLALLCCRLPVLRRAAEQQGEKGSWTLVTTGVWPLGMHVNATSYVASPSLLDVKAAVVVSGSCLQAVQGAVPTQVRAGSGCLGQTELAHPNCWHTMTSS